MMQDPMKQWECQDGVVFLKSIGVRPGDGLVDFGCRVGHYSIPAAFAVEHSGTVYAVDQDQMPLDQLMEKAREYGLENIQTVKTSGQLDLDIESHSIDVVLLYDVLHYFTQSQRQALLREVLRVLKPTGFLSVYPKHTLEDWPSKELKNLRIGDVEREIRQCCFRPDGVYEGIISHDDALVPGRVMNFRKR
jgi:ubiquinone/menaquinone biosynthesis C-methylase UbiE